MAGIRASTFYSKKSSDTRICFPSNGAISEDDDNDDLSDDSDRGETRFSRSLFLSDKVIPPSEPESSEEEIYSAPTKKCSKPMKKISAGQIVDRYANFSNHQSSKANGRAVLETKNPRTRHGVGACSQHYPATLQKKNDIRQETDLTSNRKFDLTKAAADNPRARLGFGSNGQYQSTTLEKKHRSKPGKDSMSDIDSDEAGLLDASISSPEIPFYPSILNSSSDDDTLDAETVASTCKKPARRLVFKSSDESQSTLAKPLVPQSLLDSTPPTCPFNARRKLTEGLSVKPVSETIKATCDEAQQPQSTATITNQVLQENNSCGINSVDAAVKANSAGLQSKRETIQEKDTARPVLQVLNQNRPEAMKSPVNSSPAKHLRRTRNFEKKSSVMSAVCHRHPRKISSVKVNPQQCRLPKNSQTKTFSSLDNRKDEHLPADGDIELCELGNDKPTQSSEVTQKQLKPQGESATKSLLPPALDSQKENHLPVGGDVNWTDVDLCGFGNDIVPPVQSSAVNPKKPKLQTTRKAEVLNQNRPEALKSPMNSPPAKRSRQTRNSKQNLTTIDALSHTKKTTSDVTQKQLQPQGKSLTKTRSSLDLENEKDNLLPVGGDVSWTDVDICGFGNDIIPPTQSSAENSKQSKFPIMREAKGHDLTFHLLGEDFDSIDADECGLGDGEASAPAGYSSKVPEAADAVVLCTPKSPPTTERSNQRTHLGRSSKNKKPVNYRENVDDSNDVTADPDFEPEIETVIEVENDAKKSKPSNKKKKVTAVQTKSCAKKPRTKKRFAQEMALLGEDELALGEDNSQWRDDDLPGTNIRLAVDAIDNCDRLQRPVEYFRHFIDDDVCELIVNRSNLYHMQKNGKQLNLSVDELKQFLGVWIYIGVCNLPSLRDYWHTETRVPQVANVMSFNRYQKIKASIHIADNSELEELADDPDDPGAATETQAIKNKDDRLFKIRPLMEIIKAKLKALPQENYFSIDETMIPYKGVFAGKLRQYVKGKPHKFGFKNFTLAGVSGIVYDFNMYTGKTTFDHCNLSEDVKKLGIGAMAVISLCNTIKSPETSMVFFDNWFTGFPLLAYLRDKMNILSTGTIRQNRTERCPMPSDREIIKAGRGTSVVKVNNYGVACVNWADNKVVRLASTAVGVQPETKVRRYCNESKAKREIPCPQIIELYNKNMGGVDKHDMMVEINRLPTRSKRWYLPIIGYLLDLSLVNSYLIYQRQAKQLELKPDFTTSKDFRLEVSKSLRTVEKQKGRPPSSGGAKKKDLISSPRYRVADEVRFDGLHHMPSYKKKQGRCKNCKKGKTFVVCAKCDANLCFTRPQNCFAQFHTNTATAAA